MMFSRHWRMVNSLWNFPKYWTGWLGKNQAGSTNSRTRTGVIRSRTTCHPLHLARRMKLSHSPGKACRCRLIGCGVRCRSASLQALGQPRLWQDALVHEKLKHFENALTSDGIVVLKAISTWDTYMLGPAPHYTQNLHTTSALDAESWPPSNRTSDTSVCVLWVAECPSLSRKLKSIREARALWMTICGLEICGVVQDQLVMHIWILSYSRVCDRNPCDLCSTISAWTLNQAYNAPEET